MAHKFIGSSLPSKTSFGVHELQKGKIVRGLHPAASCSYHRGEGPAGVSLYAHGRGGSEQHGFAVEAIDPFPDANPLADPLSWLFKLDEIAYGMKLVVQIP
ncbi:hypothetical protein C4D60_Mb06t10290 [Musa balbisiana]|uniref:Uncharacterized protein n=1 Tax=Musa balbisiana TaxID=52838 RepID=A0A4S8IM06_MUSBA|nr:hypothetical protein C4D60_Mb06t10290 [Musa balbisiana]